jgi:hypothetical protein
VLLVNKFFISSLFALALSGAEVSAAAFLPSITEPSKVTKPEYSTGKAQLSALKCGKSELFVSQLAL